MPESRRSLLFDCYILLGVVGLVFALIFWNGDPRLARLLANSLLLAGGTVAMALPLGTVLAVLLVKTDVVGRKLALIILVTMLFVPLYLQAAGWKASLDLLTWDPDEGTAIRRPILDRWSAAIWVHAAAAVPWVALIIGCGLWLVEPELEEEALLYGSTAQVLVQITLLRAAPAMVVAALLVLIQTCGEITVTDLFRINTYAEEYYTTGGQDAGLGRRAGWVMGGVLSALVIAGLIIVRRIAPRPMESGQRSRRRISLRRGQWLGASVLAAMILLLVAVPLGQLCYRAGVQVQLSEGEYLRTWSFRKALQIVLSAPHDFASEFAWTWLIGTVAATSALILALPLAWSARAGGAQTFPAMLCCACCLAVPGPLLGLGLIWLLNQESSPWMAWLYDRTILAPALATMIRGFPVALLVCWYGLCNVSDEQLDSAAIEGAGRCLRFWRVAVAQRGASVLAAWLLTLALTTAELSASILVVPPGIDTIPRRVFGLMHAGVSDQVAAICIASAVQVGLLVLLAVRSWSVEC